MIRAAETLDKQNKPSPFCAKLRINLHTSRGGFTPPSPYASKSKGKESTFEMSYLSCRQTARLSRNQKSELPFYPLLSRYRNYLLKQIIIIIIKICRLTINLNQKTKGILQVCAWVIIYTKTIQRFQKEQSKKGVIQFKPHAHKMRL